MTNNTAHTAISIRCAANANDIANITMARSIQKPTPTRPSLLSWRTKFTVAPKASAWIKIVHRTALAPTAKGIRIATRSVCVIPNSFPTSFRHLTMCRPWPLPSHFEPHCCEVDSQCLQKSNHRSKSNWGEFNGFAISKADGILRRPFGRRSRSIAASWTQETCMESIGRLKMLGP